MNRRRIDTVLRIRALQERLARQEVVRARHELARTQEAEATARALVDDRSAPDGRPIAAAQLQDRRAMLTSGVAHAVRVAQRVTHASSGVDESMSHWQVQAQRLDGIDRLSDKLTEQERLEAERAESALVDDLVIARWNDDDTAFGGAPT